MTEYLEVVMGLSFVVELLLLMGAGAIADAPVGKGAGLLGAGIGAVYAGACLLPGFHFLGNTLWHLVVLVFISLVAFGLRPGNLRGAVLFVLLNLALSGVASGVGEGSFGTLAASAVVVPGLCLLGSHGADARRYVTVRLCHRGTRVTITALRDTGNTLRDPISGERVLVADAWTAKQLLGLDRQQLACPVQTLAAGTVPGLRLIPYRTVGTGSGMLLAVRVEEMRMGNFRGSALVAFAPEGLEGNGAYQALTGGMA